MLHDNRAVCLNVNCDNYLQETRLCRRSLVKMPLLVSLFAFHLFWPADAVIKAGTSTAPDIKHMVLSVEFNEENLLKQLQSTGVYCAAEVFAQMKLETGGFKSSLLKETNNLMGMRYPFSRDTRACGLYLPDADTIIMSTNRAALKKYAKLNHYAVYTCWQEAVADYKLWQDSYFNGRERYLKFLGTIYAEDSLYVNKIRKIASKQ